MKIFNSIIKQAKSNPKSIVFAEGEDLRVIEAAVRSTQTGIAHCILVGHSDTIRQKAQANALDLDRIQIEDPQHSDHAASYARNLEALRKDKGMTAETANELVKDPLYFADLMLHAGDADGSIAGAHYSTGDRVRTALQIIGVAKGFTTVSSFMLMLFEQPDRVMIFSDCALVVDPSSEQLAEIALASTHNARPLIGDTPRLAMLSFSSNGSASHPLVDKVRKATELVRERAPELAVDGEIQLDAALVPAIARQKVPDSQTGGNANILIFPDLNAANIGYKIAQRLGGAEAIGPVLQGLNKPANDLSRGCSADDVYYLTALTVLQAQG